MNRKNWQPSLTASLFLCAAVLTVSAANNASAADSAADAAAMIARYGLREAAQPVSQREAWRRPTRVVVDAGVPGLIEALRQQFAGVVPALEFQAVSGQAVVTDDLVAALNSGQIAGAALDVTDPEPLPRGHPLWRAPNLLLTPHMAGERMLSVVDVGRGY